MTTETREQLRSSKRDYRGFEPRGPIPGARIFHGFIQEIPEFAQPEFSALAAAFDEPFVGITSDGTPRGDLPREPLADAAKLVDAANAFLGTIEEPDYRDYAQQPFDHPHRRRWINAFPFWTHAGLWLDDVGPKQQAAAMDLLEASLSPEGFREARAVMHANQALGDFCGYWKDTLREYAYHFAIFGEPSTSTPWMWQIMGHHLDLHCTILGDHVSFTPMFMATEMAEIDDGPFAGRRLFGDQEAAGLRLASSLTSEQQEKAVLFRSILSKDLPEVLGRPTDGRHRAGAGQDNLVLPNEGLRADALAQEQQGYLVDLVDTYLRRWPDAARQTRLSSVREHLDQTYFAWMGDPQRAPFYYRVQSPVVLIEFDHHAGMLLANNEPEPFHIHTILRTPNGGDYGMHLL